MDGSETTDEQQQIRTEGHGSEQQIRPEGREPEWLDIAATVRGFKENDLYMAALAQRFGLFTYELEARMDEFELDCRTEGTRHKEENDVKRHFCNWLRRKIEREKNGSKNSGQPADTGEKSEKFDIREFVADKMSQYYARCAEGA